MKAALGHQRQQADGFQGNRLAAGIGAGDNHGIEIRADPQGDRYDLALVDQRMAGVTQFHSPFLVHQRRPGSHPEGKLRLSEDHIQADQDPYIVTDTLTMGCCFRGKLRQDPLDLLFLFQFQFPQGVIGIHCGHRFHKISRAGGRHIVYHAGNIILKLTLHRHHITALPDGDDGLPQILGISGRGYDFLQAILDLAGLDPHMAANVK